MEDNLFPYYVFVITSICMFISIGCLMTGITYGSEPETYETFKGE